MQLPKVLMVPNLMKLFFTHTNSQSQTAPVNHMPLPPVGVVLNLGSKPIVRWGHPFKGGLGPDF